MNSDNPTNFLVLIVDDTLSSAEFLKEDLTDEGYEIQLVFGVTEVFSAVEESEPDLIILNSAIPLTRWYEVCQQLKIHHKTRTIPILILIAFNEMGEIEKAVTAGCDDFLTKPVDKTELQTRVRSLLKHS